jgi:hypothetical protein
MDRVVCTVIDSSHPSCQSLCKKQPHCLNALHIASPQFQYFRAKIKNVSTTKN